MNSPGEEISYIALGWERHVEALPPVPAGFRKDLDRVVNAVYRSEDEEQRNLAVLHSGVLTRLDSLLLQVRRMIEHRDALVQRLPEISRQLKGQAVPVGMPAAALAEKDAAADFESMLFHSRAALDLATLAIARRYRQQMHKFSNLEAFLVRLADRSPEASEAVTILRQASALSGVLTDLERTSLRSLVTHRGTFTENTSVVFCIYPVGGDRQLILDCEAFGYGLFRTAEVLAKDVPYLILNLAAVYLGAGDRLTYEACTPSWGNPTVRLSEWLDDTEKGPLLTYVEQMNPDGFVLGTRHVRPEIFEMALHEPSAT